jgi:quinol monooxygenase YgiN
MVILVVHHRVADYDAWKQVFDEHEQVRRSHGELEHRIYRDLADANRVVVHNDFPSREEAQAFLDDPSLLQVMSRAGVEGEPGVSFIERVERKEYAETAVA